MKHKKMEIIRIVLKILMFVLIIGFSSNYVLRTVSYSFYKGKKQKENVTVIPEKVVYADHLTGYGYHLSSESSAVILCFGGSFYVAYNTVGRFAPYYNVPFLSVDYYGTQDSPGKMNLSSMKASAEALYDWTQKQYPERKIIVVGHSYGCGMAAYLASVRKCDQLFLLAGFRDLSDLYNRIVPIFWGPFKVFISDNLTVAEYALHTTCPVTIVGSDVDKTLGSDLQASLATHYQSADLHIFPDIEHEHYLTDKRVISLIQKALK